MQTPTEGPATWEWWQGALGVLVAVMGSGVAVLVFFGITAIFGGDPGDPRGGVTIAGLLLQNVVFVFSVVVAANMKGGPVKPWMLGVRGPEPGWGMAALWIGAVYVTLIICGAIWDLVVNVPDPEIVDDLGVKASDTAAIFGALAICVAAPICEELLFRGLLFPSLRGRIGTAAAVIVTGLSFGAVHVVGSPVEALPLLAIFGGLLCLLYVKTRSLIPCMVVHSINNVITYAFLLDWDWQVPILLVGSLGLIFAIYRFVEGRLGPAPAHLSPV